MAQPLIFYDYDDESLKIHRYMCNTVLWQHVFQVVVYVLGAMQRASSTLHGTQYTHRSLKHMLPQHCITYNDVFLLIIATIV